MQEEFKQTTNLTKEQIKDEVEKEFQAFLERAAQKTRKFWQSYVDSGEMSAADVEKKIESNHDLFYGGADFSHKVSPLANNMYCWCPGGMYLDMLSQREEGNPDDEAVISDKKLVEDMNQCLADGGHEDSVELLQTKNLEGAEGEKRALIDWDLFKRMRAKGYDDAKLRK